MKGLREIRLYPNRRLYDCFTSRYIKSSDVVSLLQQGFELRVIDPVRKQDRTHKVLVDALVRDELSDLRGPRRLMTTEFLLCLIRTGGTVDPALVRAFLDFCIGELLRGEGTCFGQSSAARARGRRRR